MRRSAACVLKALIRSCRALSFGVQPEDACSKLQLNVVLGNTTGASDSRPRRSRVSKSTHWAVSEIEMIYHLWWLRRLVCCALCGLLHSVDGVLVLRRLLEDRLRQTVCYSSDNDDVGQARHPMWPARTKCVYLNR